MESAELNVRCGKLADQRIDGRRRYKNLPQDRVYGADTAEEAVGMVERMLRFYKPQCSVITLRRPARGNLAVSRVVSGP